MKNVFMACFALLAFTTHAQEKPRLKSAENKHISAEQRTHLKLKELTLALDLNAAQQKEIAQMLQEKQAKRAASQTAMKEKRAEKAKAEANARYERKNQMLDARIAEKARMKKILSADQYAKWENHQKERMPKTEKHIKKDKRERR